MTSVDRPLTGETTGHVVSGPVYTERAHHAHRHHYDVEAAKHALFETRWGELVSEFFGVAALVYIGGYVLLQADVGRSTALNVAVAHAAVVGLLVYVLGRYYVPQLNPAITIAAVITQRQNVISGLLYIAFQLIGGIIGALVLKWMTPDAILTAARGINTLGFPHVPANSTDGITFFNEALFTFIYVFLFYAIVFGRKVTVNALFLALGGVILVATLAVAPTSVIGLNPARVFGPAVVSDDWRDHWVFWVGPIVGAVLAAVVHDWVVAHKYRKHPAVARNAYGDVEVPEEHHNLTADNHNYDTFTNRPLIV